jgi:hypothetical protein
VEFYSPSHNVNCEIDYGAPYPDKQAFCFSSTPDQSATLSVSGSFTTCSSNCQANPASNAVELPYGEAIVLGPFKCRSADAGMFCTANGKGFQISKSGITAFSE